MNQNEDQKDHQQAYSSKQMTKRKCGCGGSTRAIVKNEPVPSTTTVETKPQATPSWSDRFKKIIHRKSKNE